MSVTFSKERLLDSSGPTILTEIISSVAGAISKEFLVSHGDAIRAQLTPEAVAKATLERIADSIRSAPAASGSTEAAEVTEPITHRQRADLVDILTSGKMPYRLEDVAKLTDREIQEQWLWDRQREGGVAHLVPAVSGGQIRGTGK